MSYKIQSLRAVDFTNMSKNELKSYFNWFISQIPIRINNLEMTVNEIEKEWTANFEPSSIKLIGKWFFSQVESRKRTEEEITELSYILKEYINIPNWDLTEKTNLIAIDIAIYFAETLIKKHPSLHWDVILKNKKFADYGQPVLIGFKNNDVLNPVRIVTNVAYGFIDKTRMENRLFELFEIWSAKVGL